MRTLDISFPNKSGAMLSAKLELPADGQAHNFALFAHCFTCDKNLNAIKHISRAMTTQGLGVLRFDFTGLGESEGDFAETSIGSNMEDLLAAADFLKKEYKAPALLIGHSFGGAAVLLTAHQISSALAVATIGAPFDPEHVTHLFSDQLDELREQGKAKVNIGGRPFFLKKKFLDDLQTVHSHHPIQNLDAALLVLHSPQDEIVSIDNATKIYKAAQHPKSYLSLDGANHLLSKKLDALYVGEVIATWAKRYVQWPTIEPLATNKQVVIRTQQEFTTEVRAGTHGFLADEPESVGGNNLGPTPYDLLVAALGTCTGMTLRIYANLKKWDLEEVRVHLEHNRIHTQDCEGLQSKHKDGKLDFIDREIELYGNLTEEQKEKLLEIANRCPVHKTLTSDIKINTALKK
ncbi:bifunctional alpha/beta hydrolase/OsmC family protein [Rapidithrix thailandica]|uniref:Bifunctional alpha/beta hydrolase/OsmC family protein n=1 Tax=Rapidithrix thailandica TaxID=413964 RepID=A0AAW9RTD0_9BACT